ncbi:MAG: hypothetical protein JO326_02755, partial [Acetobacteraceae bacterium]|nr:hypothetical protein [Acetobacteraceae bacterium]
MLRRALCQMWLWSLLLLTAPALAQNIPNQGGPIMQTNQAFLIFWSPPGHSFSTAQGGDAAYQAAIGRFFADVSGTPYFDIATQYASTCNGAPCAPGNARTTVTLGGQWTDATAYPESPLSDGDVQASINRALAANPAWNTGLGSEFFVFLPQGVAECDGAGSCSGSEFCAYHNAFASSRGNAVYAVMPQVRAIGSGCGFTLTGVPQWSPSLPVNDQPGTTPNQVDADWEIVVLSHEFFESVSDPFPGIPAWLDPHPQTGGDDEIGDHCNRMVGGVIGPDGGNVTLNGARFLVEEIWSNGLGTCALGPMLRLQIATGGDDLRGDSSADATLLAPSGAAFESGVLKAQSDGGWGNDTSDTRVLPFNAALPPALGAVNVTLTSHNSFPETDDNWNINGLDIRIADAVGHLQCEQSFAGNPYVRLTGSAGTAGFDTPNCRPAPGPDTLYDQLSFNILTGGDDLRGDSSATASVQLPGGTQTFTLKAQSDGGWENGSDHIKSFALNPAVPLSAIGQIAITLTSHNGLFETDDNWNVQDVHVTAVSSSGAIGCVLNQGGNPLARLTGSGPTVTLHPTAGCPDTWFPIGPQVRMQIGAPVSALWRSNDTHLDLFATGNDGAVWSIAYQWPSGWGAWFLPHNEVKMQPGAAVTALWRSNNTHLDLFATGTDGAVWSTWWEAGPGWQPWFQPNSQVKMQPGATVTALWRSNDTHLDLFATGNDGAVWSTWWEAAKGWQPWFLPNNQVKMQP